MPDTFEALRPALETYLRERGLDPRKRFRCLNPDHYDHDPSMGYDPKRHKVHCFACGADYDLFDLLTMDNGLSSPLEALAEAACLISHMVDELRDIAEVDLNPVFAWEKGLAVADARIVLQAR